MTPNPNLRAAIVLLANRECELEACLGAIREAIDGPHHDSETINGLMLEARERELEAGLGSVQETIEDLQRELRGEPAPKVDDDESENEEPTDDDDADDLYDGKPPPPPGPRRVVLPLPATAMLPGESHTIQVQTQRRVRLSRIIVPSSIAYQFEIQSIGIARHDGTNAPISTGTLVGELLTETAADGPDLEVQLERYDAVALTVYRRREPIDFRGVLLGYVDDEQT